VILGHAVFHFSIGFLGAFSALLMTFQSSHPGLQLFGGFVVGTAIAVSLMERGGWVSRYGRAGILLGFMAAVFLVFSEVRVFS